ncbi:MAG: hypothetical protein RL681_329 [Candidatus Parcubacteria bacterium]|jgi:hypothetical protein
MTELKWLEVILVVLLTLTAVGFLTATAGWRFKQGFPLMVLSIFGALFVLTRIGPLVQSQARTAEAANPSVLVTCADGVRDCTLMLALSPEILRSLRPADTWLWAGSDEPQSRWLRVEFTTRKRLQRKMPTNVWLYHENSLALPDGRMVNMEEIRHVAVAPVGRLDEVFKQFDVE